MTHVSRHLSDFTRMPCYGQDAAKCQPASMLFTQRPKISIFALQGRLIEPIYVKFGMAKWHMGPLGHAKFHLNVSGYATPKTLKISTFW